MDFLQLMSLVIAMLGCTGIICIELRGITWRLDELKKKGDELANRRA